MLCTTCVFSRFVLCDPEEGLYQELEQLDQFDPDIEVKRRQLRLDRQNSLVQQVDFDKYVLTVMSMYRLDT